MKTCTYYHYISNNFLKIISMYVCMHAYMHTGIYLYIFYFMYLGLCLPVSVHYVKEARGVEHPKTCVIDSSVLLCGCWESNFIPLEE